MEEIEYGLGFWSTEINALTKAKIQREREREREVGRYIHTILENICGVIGWGGWW